jgi:small subunit ribosomal protein S20
MAITTSAKKAARVSARKYVFNLRRVSVLRSATKDLKQALAAKDVKKAESLLSAAYAAIDKAAKRGVIKSGNAARKKARLVAAIRRIST